MVILLSIISSILIFMVQIYKKYISPFMQSNCRFYPTCSAYAIVSLRRFSLLKSIKLIVIRLLKCHPLHMGGYDSVPTKNKDRSEH